MSLILQNSPAANLPAQPTRASEEHVVAEQTAPTLGAVGEERPFFRLDLLRALHLHRRLALGIAFTGIVLAATMAVRMWPIYTAKSQIYIQPVPPRVMDQDNAPRWPYDANTYDSFIQQQVQSASNPEVLLAALRKMPAGSFQRDGENEQSAARRLGKTLEVARVGTSYEVSITARTGDPASAAQVANAVANSIVERASGEANAGDAQRLAILKEEQARVQKALDDDHAEQDSLNKQLGMASVSSTAPDLIDNAIDKTREELIHARTAHDEAEAKFNALGAGNTSSSALNAQADEMIAADAGLTSMKTSLNQRRAVLISQMANLTPSNPAYKQDSDELAKINSNLDSMMSDLRTRAAARLQQQLRAQLASTAGVESQLNGQLRQLTGTAASATPRLQRASDLTADVTRLQTRYAAVDEQIHNLMLQDSVPGAVHVSVPAVAPLHPTLSGIVKKTLPIALAGILLGLFAALVAHNMDQRIYIAADVEQVLNAAPMAVLPSFNEVSDETAAEHLLRIATSLEHACKQGGLRRVIFTGASLGVGTTTVAARVNEILQAMGRATALIHASGAQERGSRSSALLQQVAEGAAPQPAQDADKLVITDAAPLTISAETAYLARFVDCVIVVVESGVTTRPQLREVSRTLQRLNVSAAGFVLNRVSLAKADPAFRNSVQAVESHLRASAWPAPQPEVRTRQVEPEPAYAPHNDEPQANGPEVSEPQVSEAPSYKPRVYEPLPYPQEVEEPAVSAFQPEAPAPHNHNIDPIVPEQTPAPQPAAPKPESDVPWWLADSVLQSATSPAPQPEPPAMPDSRLGGLRNIFVRPAPAQPAGPAPLSEETLPPQDRDVEVAALPEFLPPRHERREDFDDLAILPSRRGQYRRKR